MLLKEENYKVGDYPFSLFSDKEPGTKTYFYKKHNPVSTNEIEIDNLQVSVFPNPVIDQLTLELPSNTDDHRMIIYDTSGRPHLQLHNYNKTIDVSRLPSGLYYYTIELNGKRGTGQFVKL